MKHWRRISSLPQTAPGSAMLVRANHTLLPTGFSLPGVQAWLILLAVHADARVLQLKLWLGSLSQRHRRMHGTGRMVP